MIKRGLFIFALALMLTSLASAQIIIHTQPNEVYNIGDSQEITLTVKSLVATTDIFNMDLICNGQIINFYKNGISLTAGEEKDISASLIFTKGLIGEAKGNCVIKGTFGEEYVTTNEFKLSDSINLIPDLEITTFTPGTSILIEGNAIKENGQSANGFINLEILIDNQTNSITKIETINNGFFSANITLPEDMKAGKYLLKLNAYEEEPNYGETNKGFINQNIDIIQVPKSLEIVFENKEIKPGTNAKLRVILHDQTGENIESNVNIIVKDNKSKIIQKTEEQTDSIFEIPISNNEKPLTWSIQATKDNFETESDFNILENKEINMSLTNNTIIITNVGNVFYNESANIKIGNETINIPVSLDVGKEQEYKLSAPDGEYMVTLGEGDNEFTQSVSLTGRAISAKEKKTGSNLFFSFAWIFIILVLGSVTYMFFNKGHKKTFFGHMPKFLKKKQKTKITNQLKNNSKLTSRNRAEVSLSIIGDKQKSTIICLYIKNLREIQQTKNNTEETLQKIINFAENNKATTYENQNNLCFILTPLKTKTFKNETMALEIAQFTEKILKEHNKIFKQRIEFGISINNGIIIAKAERESMKFTSMGSFVANAKKIASLSHEEILFSKEISDKLRSKIKSDKLEGEEEIYKIKEVKQYNETNKKFIENFIKKYEKHSD